MPPTLIRLRPQLAALASAVVLVVGLAACGGSSRESAARPATHTPAQSNPDIGGRAASAGGSASRRTRRIEAVPTQPAPTKDRAKRRAASTAADQASIAPQPQQKARAGGQPNDTGSASAAKMLNPCSLVPAAQAEAAVGSPITARIVAPLGPTCIYKVRGSKTDITMAVEVIHFNQIRHQMRRATPLQIGGRAGYCGTLGQTQLLLSLAGGRVLNVTAGCGVAKRLAAVALSHLAA
jgi:hypothetical protein